MTYPLKFRQKVLETRAREGVMISAVASRFGVCIASVVRSFKEPAPKTTRVKPATKIDMAALAEDVLDQFSQSGYRFGVSNIRQINKLERVRIRLNLTRLAI